MRRPIWITTITIINNGLHSHSSPVETFTELSINETGPTHVDKIEFANKVLAEKDLTSRATGLTRITQTRDKTLDDVILDNQDFEQITLYVEAYGY